MAGNELKSLMLGVINYITMCE